MGQKETLCKRSEKKQNLFGRYMQNVRRAVGKTSAVYLLILSENQQAKNSTKKVDRL